MKRLDPNIIKQQIENLLVHFPELQEDEQLRADMIEGETEAFDFLRMVEQRRQQANAMFDAIAMHIDQLAARQDRFHRREQAMRSLAFTIMSAADLPKIELPEATLTIRNGTPKVIITDETLIPDILCRIKREPDKNKIKELLTSNNLVRGAELSNAEPTLSIRTK